MVEGLALTEQRPAGMELEGGQAWVAAYPVPHSASQPSSSSRRAPSRSPRALTLCCCARLLFRHCFLGCLCFIIGAC